jgi:hypothetical protein
MGLGHHLVRLFRPSGHSAGRPARRPRLGPVAALEDRVVPSSVVLGPSDNIALDQPRVTVLLSEDPEGAQEVGPFFFNTFLLDTGANSILVMASAVTEMTTESFYPYQTDGTFLEHGVGGPQPFDLSAPYYLHEAANGNGYVPLPLGETRVLSNPDEDFSIAGPWGIMGMPGMTGRVTTFDYSVWSGGLNDELSNLYLGTAFGDAVPDTTRPRFSVPLDNRIEFHPEDGVVNGGGTPAWADVPFLTAVPVNGGVAQPGNFLFDTGAQLSIISRQMATALGLDSNGDGEFDSADAAYLDELAVGGVGGEIAAPVFAIDEVRLPTEQGVELVWTNLQWLILDIDTGDGATRLDGVFGSDLLTSGWVTALFGNEDGSAGADGYLAATHVDFRGWDATGEGKLYLDLAHPVPPPPAPLPTLAVGGAAADEGNSGPVDLVFTVTLSEPADQPVTVQFATADGTAAAGSDYVAASGTLTFAPGTTSQTVTVRVNGDGTFEPDEALTLRLSAPGGAVITTATATGTIRNDDPVVSPPPPNSPPAVSDVADLTVAADGTTGPLGFTVSDEQTAVADLVVTATSSDPTLVPPAGVVLGGSGGSRTVTVTPAAGQTGTATITLTVTDAGGLTAADTFVLTVSPPPPPPPVLSPPPPATQPPVVLPPPPPPVAGMTRTFATGAMQGGAPVVTVRNPDGSAAAQVQAFDPPYAGEVRVATADLTGDGVADVAVGTGPGSRAQVRVLDGATGAELFRADPFDGFTGGVFVAVGDVTGDGRAELVVTPDQSGGPRVVVYRGGDFAKAADFFGIEDPGFRGGARAGVGDLDGDGRADVVVSAGFGGGPRLSVYDGAALTRGERVHPVGDFFLFADALRNGAYVAVGDVDGDGFADVVGGAGPGGGPRVLTLSGRTLMTSGSAAAVAAPVTNFFGGDPGNRGGVRVAVKDLDGDARADLVVGDGQGGGSRVTTYAGKDFAGGGAPEMFGIDLVPGSMGGVFVG